MMHMRTLKDLTLALKPKRSPLAVFNIVFASDIHIGMATSLDTRYSHANMDVRAQVSPGCENLSGIPTYAWGRRGASPAAWKGNKISM